MHQLKVGTAWLKWYQVQHDVTHRQLAILVAPFAVVAIVEQVLLLVNVFLPAQELYELALILMLGTPALVFVVW